MHLVQHRPNRLLVSIVLGRSLRNYLIRAILIALLGALIYLVSSGGILSSIHSFFKHIVHEVSYGREETIFHCILDYPTFVMC